MVMVDLPTFTTNISQMMPNVSNYIIHGSYGYVMKTVIQGYQKIVHYLATHSHYKSYIQIINQHQQAEDPIFVFELLGFRKMKHTSRIPVIWKIIAAPKSSGKLGKNHP